jgi:hypothetical protein
MIRRSSTGEVCVLEALLLTSVLLSQQNAGAASCAAIEEDSARLTCYDAYFRGPAVKDLSQTSAQEDRAVSPKRADEVAHLPVERQSPPAPATRGVASAPSPQDEFGLTQAQREARARIEHPETVVDSIEARVLSTSVSASGRLVLRLDNGQTWMQVEPSQSQHFRPGDKIKIRTAALGSFLASGPKSRTGVRIRRVE